MKREPIILYLFRLFLSLSIIGLLALLYWSSILIEEQIKWMQKDLAQIKNSLSFIKRELESGTSIENKTNKSSPATTTSSHTSTNKNNLLTADPFYLRTIKNLLPSDFEPHGTRRDGVYVRPNTLHPFNNLAEIVEWNGLCTVALATLDVGIYETLAPDAALSMDIRSDSMDRPEYWIELRQDLFWQPLNPRHFSEGFQLDPLFLQKHQVTAHDFKFYYDAVMNPHVEGDGATAMRGYYNDIEEVRVVSDFTLVVRWKTKPFKDEAGKETLKMKYQSTSLTGSLRPFPRFVYQYFSDGTKIVEDDSDPDTYRKNPVWAQNFAHHFANNVIVSCGPWLFDGMTEREIRFIRNPDFYNPYAVLADRYEVQFKDSPDTLWGDFKLGKLDLFTVPPNLLTELNKFLTSAPYEAQVKQGLTAKKLEYLMRSYTYVGWNEKNPLFNSKKVRQALTMAIDRERIIRQNLNGMGIQTTGTFSPLSPSYDKDLKPYPFDPRLSIKYLKEEGWTDSDGDGIIDKLINGKLVPFRFTLTYYVKNPTTKSICEYISTTLKEIGIDCITNGVDTADLSAIFEDKSFDALIFGWILGTPPEDPRQLWHSSGAKLKGSSNSIGFANSEIDKIIEELEYEDDQKKRVELYHRFDAIIYEEAPYTFLYVPKTTLAYRDYLKNVFIPADRQDIIPGANMEEPISSIFWLSEVAH